MVKKIDKRGFLISPINLDEMYKFKYANRDEKKKTDCNGEFEREKEFIRNISQSVYENCKKDLVGFVEDIIKEKNIEIELTEKGDDDALYRVGYLGEFVKLREKNGHHILTEAYTAYLKKGIKKVMHYPIEVVPKEFAEFKPPEDADAYLSLLIRRGYWTGPPESYFSLSYMKLTQPGVELILGNYGNLLHRLKQPREYHESDSDLCLIMEGNNEKMVPYVSRIYERFGKYYVHEMEKHGDELLCRHGDVLVRGE